MAKNSKDFWQRMRILVGLSVLGLIFIVAGFYWWLPLIFVGLIIVALGYIFSGQIWFP